MKKVSSILTILFGLFWLVFGLNNFFHFFAIPEPSAEGAAFMEAMAQTGYMLPIIYSTEIIAGLLLISLRFVPLALLMLGPVIANILLYDLFLNPSGLVIGAIISVLYLLLLWKKKDRFLPVLTP